jgi:hypothetical protein
VRQSDLLRFYDAEEGPLKISSAYIKKLKRSPTKIANANECIPLHMELSSKNAELANEFFAKILTGVGIAANTWEKLLRDRLSNAVNQKKDSRYYLGEPDRRKLFILTWNKIRENQPVGKLKMPIAMPDIQ